MEIKSTGFLALCVNGGMVSGCAIEKVTSSINALFNFKWMASK